MYNVLFPSGRVLELGSLDLACTYCKAYNGVILPQETLDNGPVEQYNGFVVNDKELLEIL